MKGQILLGSNNFERMLDQQITQKEKLSEIPRNQLYATRTTLDTILQKQGKKDFHTYQASHPWLYSQKYFQIPSGFLKKLGQVGEWKRRTISFSIEMRVISQ